MNRIIGICISSDFDVSNDGRHVRLMEIKKRVFFSLGLREEHPIVASMVSKIFIFDP
jgi:hypothetical protein